MSAIQHMFSLAPQLRDFLGVVLLVILGVVHGRTERTGSLPMILWRLPSTVIHEAAHYFMALIFQAGPSDFSLLPQRIAGGWVLGNVTCERIGVISAFPVGWAPFIINLPLAWLSFKAHTLAGFVWTYVFLAASVPSRQDLRVATSSWIGLGVWGVVAVLAVWLLLSGILF